jgi:23S rRNA (adenine2030-N6)-methyltransferase
MNYRHIFHAGNFADVMKHCTLIALIQSFFHKDKPIFYLDTHAGCDVYNLEHPAAKKTGEYRHGIGKIYQQKNAPKLINDYLAIVHQCNVDSTQNKIHYYPGSAQFVRSLLRPYDRMALIELSAKEYEQLQMNFQYNKQIAVHHQDAYQALNALLPPIERRGLVFIDPTYEQANETELIVNALVKAIKKWAEGVYVLWYPIKNQSEQKLLLKTLKQALSTQEILCVELSIYPTDAPLGLNGSGMIIINPPWQIEQKIAEFLPWLWHQLSVSGQGGYHVEWL